MGVLEVIGRFIGRNRGEGAGSFEPFFVKNLNLNFKKISISSKIQKNLEIHQEN